MTESSRTLSPSGAAGLMYYGLAAALVAVFIETFPAWQWLSRTLPNGGAAGLPVVLLAAVFAVLLLPALRKGRTATPRRWLMLASALALAVAALLLCDPRFPAKRIHVAEYVLIAVVLRRAACAHAGGAALTVYVAILGALLGVHDELIQGLHPDRTFGLRDILVNAAAATSGALIGGALGLFDGLFGALFGARRDAGETPPRPSWAATPVALGLVLFLIALPPYRDLLIPWWTLTPLLAGGAIWCAQRSSWPGIFPHPYPVAVWLALAAAVYPVIVHETPLVFH